MATNLECSCLVVGMIFKSRFFDDKKHKEKNYEGEKDKLNCITERSVLTKEF